MEVNQGFLKSRAKCRSGEVKEETRLCFRCLLGPFRGEDVSLGGPTRGRRGRRGLWV